MCFCIRWTKIKEFSENLCTLQPNLGQAVHERLRNGRSKEKEMGKDNLLGAIHHHTPGPCLFAVAWSGSDLGQLIQDTYRIDGSDTDSGR